MSARQTHLLAAAAGVGGVPLPGAACTQAGCAGGSRFLVHDDGDGMRPLSSELEEGGSAAGIAGRPTTVLLREPAVDHKPEPWMGCRNGSCVNRGWTHAAQDLTRLDLAVFALIWRRDSCSVTGPRRRHSRVWMVKGTIKLYAPPELGRKYRRYRHPSFAQQPLDGESDANALRWQKLGGASSAGPPPRAFTEPL